MPVTVDVVEGFGSYLGKGRDPDMLIPLGSTHPASSGDPQPYPVHAEGALRALRWGKQQLPTESRVVHICLDNTSVLTRLIHANPYSSLYRFVEFRALVAGFPGRVEIHWSPGHSDIEGNEAADLAAGSLADQALPPKHPSRQDLRFSVAFRKTHKTQRAF
ncbi:hypothetical protein GGS21DRAFT_494819 [Xylaria nigripes]|nr:hypothetical protein GGS21DRAFT_494819 [Xylaria nigripes]